MPAVVEPHPEVPVTGHDWVVNLGLFRPFDIGSNPVVPKMFGNVSENREVLSLLVPSSAVTPYGYDESVYPHANSL